MKYSHCPDCGAVFQRLPRNAGRAMIWLYRHTLSPLVGLQLPPFADLLGLRRRAI